MSLARSLGYDDERERIRTVRVKATWPWCPHAFLLTQVVMNLITKAADSPARAARATRAGLGLKVNIAGLAKQSSRSHMAYRRREPQAAATVRGLPQLSRIRRQRAGDTLILAENTRVKWL